MPYNQQNGIKRGSIYILIICGWLTLLAAIIYAPRFLSNDTSDKTLNIFTWPGLFDAQLLQEFEEQAGVKVNLSYYDSNEELLVKLRVTGGTGYDIVVPSDYAIDVLRKEGVLKKLDRTKIPVFKDINKHLLGHYFDPQNEYSLPYEWSIFGFGIDSDFFKTRPRPTGWSDVFDPQKIAAPLVMPNDPLLSIPFASYYVYNSIKAITPEKLTQLRKAVIEQQPYVMAYIDARADYLLATKNCPLVVSSSSYIARSMLEYDHIDFVVPREGTILTIENIAVPETSKKDDLIYAFINFMYRPDIVKKQFESYLFFPAVATVYDSLPVPERIKKLIMLGAEEFKRFDFFKLTELQDGLTEQDLQHMWITIKK